MLPPPADRPKLEALLRQLESSVEGLFLSGLTTASEATRQTIAAALQEAARFRLLRLGSALRSANEELTRFTARDETFSRKRMAFFLSRAWLLGRGLGHALRTGDEKEYDRLTWSPPVVPLPQVEVVCLGAVKRVAAGAFTAFEFRFRVAADAPPLKAGDKLAWSCVFPTKPGLEIPPEGFLHLPQKQKFTPTCFLERKTVVIAAANLACDPSGDRLSLTEKSTVTIGSDFTEWEQFLEWSPAAAAERIRKHKAGPLDLDTEWMEEVVLRDYVIGPPAPGDSPGQTVFPIAAGGLAFSAVVGSAADGEPLREALEDLRKRKGKDLPPLFGLLHYERCRLVFQPLSAFRPQPEYLTISQEKINRAALLKALSFT